MSLPIKIVVPIHDIQTDELSTTPNSPPVRIRLESYKNGGRPFCRSPEQLRESTASAAERAKAHIEGVKQKAKHHNDECTQRVKRRLAFEQEAKENLRKKIVDSISSAEERRKQRQAAVRLKNEQHHMNMMKAKAASEVKAHEVARFHAEAVQLTACARLAKELKEHAEANDFGRLSQWMRAPTTVETVRAAFERLGAPGANPKLLLAVASMAMDADGTFSDSDQDAIMKREALRFHRRLLKALRTASVEDEAAAKEEQAATETVGGDDGDRVAPPVDAARHPKTANAEPFAASARRASRFYSAWAAHDKPHTLEQLMASVVAQSVRQREQEGRTAAQMQPPEETLAQIRRLGGAGAEAEARRRFAGAWQTVRTGAQLEQTVQEVATRAFWDALAHHVSTGNFDALFSVLGELQQAMRALIAHSPAAVDELSDKFDVDFLKQQADHGALEPETVHHLMRYVARTIAGWGAPADDAEARAWVDATEASVAAHAREELPTFITTCLLPFLRGAHERLQRVYTRTLEFAEDLARQRRTEETLAAAEAAAATPSAPSADEQD